MNDNEQNKHTPLFLVVIFIFIVFGIGISGYFYYVTQKDNLKKEKYNELFSIANLKQAQLTDWRKERKAESVFLFDNELFRDLVNSILINKLNGNLERKTIEFLRPMFNSHDYDNIILFDTTGKYILSVAEFPEKLSTLEMQELKYSKEIKHIFFSDIELDSTSNKIHLNVYMPILSINMTDTLVTGILIFKIDPKKNFFPLTQSYPIPTATTETILIRKENGSIVYLNELKYLRNTPLQKVEEDKFENSIINQAISGSIGIVEGKDYRGINVLADIRQIPETNWIMIIKTDSSEIFKPIFRTALYISILIIVLVLASASIIGFLWRHREAKYYKERLETENKQNALIKKYLFIIQNANDIILLLDKNGNITDVNNAALKTYGYKIEELENQNISFIRTEKAQNYAINILQNIDFQNGFTYENEHIKKDGTIFPVEVSINKLFYLNSEYFQLIIRDISQRKQMENKIVGLNRIYAVLSQINQVIIRIQDRDTLFNEVCKIAVNYGYFKLAFIGTFSQDEKKFVPAAFYGADKDIIENVTLYHSLPQIEHTVMWLAINEGKSCYSNNILEDDNMFAWHEYTKKQSINSVAAIPLKFNNKVIGSFSVFSTDKDFFDEQEIRLLEEIGCDISFALDLIEKENERKKLEILLKESLNRFRITLKNSPIVVATIDKDLKYEWIHNPHPDFNLSDVIKKTDTELSDNNGSKILQETKKRVIESGIRQKKIIAFELSDKTHYFEMIIEPIIDEQGNITGATTVAVDITEKMETKELLTLAKETAEEANNFKSVILSNVSHELRTPLNGMLGFSKILYDEITDGEHREYLELIISSGQRLLKTINSILSISEIESGLIQLRKESIHLSSYLMEFYSSVETNVKSKGLDFILNSKEHRLFIKADSYFLHQILFHLVDNAIKFTNKGSITIESDVYIAQNHTSIIVKVIDTGFGMDTKQLNKLFELFRQGSEGLNREYEGSGLGLSIVKRLVDLLEGKIEIESKENIGTTFSIILTGYIDAITI